MGVKGEAMRGTDRRKLPFRENGNGKGPHDFVALSNTKIGGGGWI